MKIDGGPERIGGESLEIAANDPIRIGTADGAPSPFAPNDVSGPDFGSILAKGLDDANALQLNADAKVDALARGASDDLHGAMITAKEADISLKLVGTVRNRLLDAFHELWRINL